MFRAIGACFLLAAGLAACGTVITISVPGGGLSRSFPEGYERFASPAPHAFRFSESGEPVRRGKISERFELRDGDCGGNDCGKPWYRTEIGQTPDATSASLGSDIWYGWSFYNENLNSVSNQSSLGLMFGQWKLESDRPSIFRIAQVSLGDGNWQTCDPAVCDRSGDATMDVVVSLEDMRTANNWGPEQNSGLVCRLFSMAQNRGKWVDLVANTNFSPDANGYLRIWVNGELRCNYSGPLVSVTSALKSAKDPNQRRGIFAARAETWETANVGAIKPTMVVYYDEFLEGERREDVDPHYREANRIKPKD